MTSLPSNLSTLLRNRATDAKSRSYSPYSHFRVGAALLDKEGRVFAGCNVENAAYTPSLCAERCAVGVAVVGSLRGLGGMVERRADASFLSQNSRSFLAVAVSSDSSDWITPCGVCRQVLREFAPDPSKLEVHMSKNTKENGEEWMVKSLEELLPMGFGPEDLGKVGK